MAIIYKIRNKATGQYATGAARFTKNGKVWNAIGHLRLHIELHSDEYKRMKDDVEIVVIQVSQEELETISFKDQYDAAMQRIKDRDAERKVRYAQYEKECAERELAALKKKHPELFK